MKFFGRLLLVTILTANALPLVAFAQTTPPPTCVITATPSSIEPGGSVTLKWQSTNAVSGTITGVGMVSPIGQLNVLPSTASQTTFVASFTGPGGTGQCSTTVVVIYSNSGSSGSTDTSGTNSATLGQQQVQSTQTQDVNWTAQPIPATTGQAQGSLVQCGQSSNPLIATECQACNLAQLIQNIINFIIGLSIPIVAALFAWAGVLYFTSADRPANLTRAKEIFLNAFIGFVIVLTGWLIVNTILHAIFKPPEGGSWFSIRCANNDPNVGRPRNGNINQVLSILPVLSSINTGTGGVNSGNVGTTGATGDDIQNRKLLNDNGISVTSTGNCADKTNRSCTSLDGVGTDILTSVIQLKNDSGQNLVVSGGTEQGIHVSSAQNSGQSLDVKFSDPALNTNTTAINNLIQTAQNEGKRLVWEPGPGGSCAGISSCLAGTGTGAHASLYLK